MPKSLEAKANSGTDRDEHVAFLRMSKVRVKDIAKIYDISPDRVRVLIKRYERRCEALKQCPFKELRSDHPNIDVIKALYEGETNE